MNHKYFRVQEFTSIFIVHDIDSESIIYVLETRNNDIGFNVKLG